MVCGTVKMRIVNEPLLASLRTPGRCEWCKRPCRAREVAHIRAKGLGSGGRYDVRINLVSLGIGLWSGEAACHCHSEHHAGHEPTRIDLLAVVAAREDVMQDEIEAVMDLLARLPKRPRQAQIDAGLEELTGSAQRLWHRTWREIPDECK